MIRYIRLNIFLKDKKTSVHPFIGSTIRGSFGVSLKKVVCINPSYNFEGCFAKENSLYLLTKKPPLEILLYSIQNRLHQLKNLPQIKLTFTPKYKEAKSSITFKDQTRRSNRQKIKLQIGGIVGFIEYEEIDENSLLLLQLGEIIGVGKQTVFGMGKIKVNCTK